MVGVMDLMQWEGLEGEEERVVSEKKGSNSDTLGNVPSANNNVSIAWREGEGGGGDVTRVCAPDFARRAQLS